MHLSVKPISKPGLPIRAVEDHHVDRMDVEAWQHVKLTITNCSIGLNLCPFGLPNGATRSDKFTVSDRPAFRKIEENVFANVFG